ncbi:M14 family metallopeptidase [soil metagenome]
MNSHPVHVEPPVLSRWASSPTGVAYVHERVAGVHERAAGAPGPEVLVTALVHGNEYSGALALDAFLRSGLLPRRGRITAAFCNIEAFGNFDAARPDASRFIDEDFNRVWSADALDGTGQTAERLRARALRPFVDRATHLLDLHSMHEPCVPLMVTGLLPRNIAFAQSLQVAGDIIVDAGHADGQRMRDYGPFGEADGSRIALLLEAGQHWDPSSVAVARNMLMRFLLRSGAIDSADVPQGWLMPDAAAAAPVTVTHRVVARSMGFEFLGAWRGGEVIPAVGTAIAMDAGEPVLTPYDDCVLVMPSLRQLRPGVTTVRLGKRGT